MISIPSIVHINETLSLPMNLFLLELLPFALNCDLMVTCALLSEVDDFSPRRNLLRRFLHSHLPSQFVLSNRGVIVPPNLGGILPSSEKALWIAQTMTLLHSDTFYNYILSLPNFPVTKPKSHRPQNFLTSSHAFCPAASSGLFPSHS